MTSLSQFRTGLRFAGLDFQVIRFPFCGVTVITPDWIQACKVEKLVSILWCHRLNTGLDLGLQGWTSRYIIRFPFCDVTVKTPDWIQVCRAGLFQIIWSHFVASQSQLRTEFRLTGLDFQVSNQIPFCGVTVTTLDLIQVCRAGLPGRKTGFHFVTSLSLLRTRFRFAVLDFQVNNQVSILWRHCQNSGLDSG